jgi:hypothetical protein
VAIPGRLSDPPNKRYENRFGFWLEFHGTSRGPLGSPVHYQRFLVALGKSQNLKCQRCDKQTEELWRLTDYADLCWNCWSEWLKAKDKLWVEWFMSKRDELKGE